MKTGMSLTATVAQGGICMNTTSRIRYNIEQILLPEMFYSNGALMLFKMMGAQGVVISVGGLNFAVAALNYIQIKKLIGNRAKGIWAK